MGARWAEDFERYPSVASMLQGAWAIIDESGGSSDGFFLSGSNPRTGSQSLAYNGNFTQSAARARRIIGGAVPGAGVEYGLWINQLPTADENPTYDNAVWICQWLDQTGAFQSGATIGSDGSIIILELVDGVLQIASRGDPIVQAQTYVQVGVKCGLVDSVNGLAEVRINNVTAANAAGINTNPTGYGSISHMQIRFGDQAHGSIALAYIDDMHLWDTIPGNGPTDFVGNAACVRRKLNADTSRADMTIVGGSHGYTVLGDSDDATLIEAGNVGLRSEFVAEMLPTEVTGVIYQQINFRASKDNIGDCNVTPYVATPGTSPETSTSAGEKVMSAADQWYFGIVASEPTTGMPFTPDQVNADRIGFERTL